MRGSANNVSNENLDETGGTHRDRVLVAQVARERAHERAALDVPDAQAAVAPRTREQRAVAAQREAEHLVRVPRDALVGRLSLTLRLSFVLRGLWVGWRARLEERRDPTPGVQVPLDDVALLARGEEVRAGLGGDGARHGEAVPACM